MKTFVKLLTLSICLALLLTSTTLAQVGKVDRSAEVKPKLMILGTYHMRTTTKNVINSQVCDVMTPERQKQISELIEKLKQFKPTKVVFEADIIKNEKYNEDYRKYLSGNFELTSNEVHQLGFRLAKVMGHKQISCVDWRLRGEGPDVNYIKFAAKYPDLDEFLKIHLEELNRYYDEEDRKMLEMTVSDQLAFLNAPEKIAHDHQLYYDTLRIAHGYEYCGADWLASRYSRNFKIFMNIIRVIESPEDRVLVIYGVGHAKLLNEFATESGFFDMVSPLEYLRGESLEKSN